MEHQPSVQAETRDLPPVDGWRRVERTGRARATCPCGLDTGMVPTSDAWGKATEHDVATSS
ncbi:hypothetical protein [Streptomyces bacillaris]|uniref:hypothetical protein n=1 Tax=Streptomyces bacillaris TaxID=68179 RepID=UPI003819A744